MTSRHTLQAHDMLAEKTTLWRWYIKEEVLCSYLFLFISSRCRRSVLLWFIIHAFTVFKDAMGTQGRLFMSFLVVDPIIMKAVVVGYLALAWI